MLAQKLGLASLDGEGDDKLLERSVRVLSAVETDMTIFFRAARERAGR